MTSQAWPTAVQWTPTMYDVYLISSGTLAGLTGLTQYTELESYLNAWLLWLSRHEVPGERWPAAHARYTRHVPQEVRDERA